MTIQNTFTHDSGQFITCGDADLYVEQLGADDAPVLIMLHGGFGNMEDFNKITPILSHHFKLVGIDSRGHGKSHLGANKLTYEQMTNDLANVIDALQLESFHILGFSDGGTVAYRYAARQDGRLQKVITVGAGWEINQDELAWGLVSAMTPDKWKNKFPHSYESYQQLNPAPDFNQFAKAVIGMWTDLGPDGHPGELVQNIVNELLIVRGDHDPLSTLDSMVKLSKIVPNTSIFNIPFAEHVAFIDATEPFLWGLGRFFAVESGAC